MSEEEEIRLFTADEANKLLPEVIPLVESLRDAHAAKEAIQDEVMGSIVTNGGGVVHRTFLDASSEAARAIETLSDIGVVVRDPESGLIDFPSDREGEIVYLCFQLGEDEVAWWHPPETGRAGRQPL